MSADVHGGVTLVGKVAPSSGEVKIELAGPPLQPYRTGGLLPS